jgi:hypothetical protein
MKPAPQRRLPVDLAVRRSYLYAWESRAILGLPCALYAGVTMVAELLLLAIFGHSSKMADYALLAAEEIFAVAFAVGVHRFVLLGEAPAGFGFFRFDRHFVQYLLMAIVLVILGIFVAMPGLMMMGAPGADADIGTRGPAALISTVVTIVAAVVISRLIMTLPAAATGDPLSTRAIWDATTGNGVRLFATMLLTILPFLAIEGVLVQFVPAAPADGAQPWPVSTAEWLITAIICLVAPVQTVVCNIMLSLCYDALVRGGGPPPR